jgi:uncharacterized protein YecE (DUF72 family)
MSRIFIQFPVQRSGKDQQDYKKVVFVLHFPAETSYLTRMLPKKELEQKHLYIKEPHLLKTVAQFFLDALYPLMRTRKLGILLFQFPPRFYYNRENLEYIL